MDKVKTVYLAGKITGDPNYRDKFAAAARELEAAGYVVLNPASLPPTGLEYDAYMRIGCAMLEECDEICLLPDWMVSGGATYEYGYAAAQGKRAFLYAEWCKGEPDVVLSKFTKEKTGKIAFRCLDCGHIDIFSVKFSDGKVCSACNGKNVPFGYVKVGY